MLETFNIMTTALAKALAEDGAAIFKKI